MLIERKPGDTRSEERIRAHYEIERELAARLMNATRDQRARLYACLYDEMYRRVPDHPQLSRKFSAEQRAHDIRLQMLFLRRFIPKDARFVEVGPGDCALTIHVSTLVREAIGVDVSAEITKELTTPPNMRIAISDGVSVPVAADSVDIAYSHQLMEHLHPDDALEQLRNIRTALKPGGLYVCVTPNRLTGPHDVSVCFDDVAQGFHVKEYTFCELADIVRRAGFSEARAYIGGKGIFRALPMWLLARTERHYGSMNALRRRALKRRLPLRLLSTIRIVAKK